MIKIFEGVRLDKDNKFIINHANNENSDIINIIEPHIYKQDSKKNNHYYYFGYRFKDFDDISKSDKKNFINYLKRIGNSSKIADYELEEFIRRPIYELSKEVKISQFDCFISPGSGRSDLVTFIVRAINKILQNSDTTHRYLFEAIKQVPTDMLKFEGLKCKSILILDDINTSGATINEILEIINELNSNCDVYIYTLIGTEN